MEKQEKWVEYATIIQSHLALLYKEGEQYIDISELNEEENLQAFFHALATVVPCHFFNILTGEEKNHIEFNHVANLLCFQFVKIKKNIEQL